MEQKQNNRSRTLLSLLTSLACCVAALFAVYFILRLLGIDMTSSIAGVGIVTLILGFGTQSLVEDVVTGIFLIAEGKYNIGDIIVLDDFRGKVVNISIRTTTIEDMGGNQKIVNNSDIRNFQNRSRVDSKAVSMISMTYGADLRKVEEIINANLDAMYERNKDVFLSAPVYLGVDKLNESGVDLKFVVSTKEENIFSAQRKLNRELRLLFADHNIEIPFPQLTLHKGE